MELAELVKLTAEDLVARMEKSPALGVFAKHRAKFEGWLKVELIEILIAKEFEAVPEYCRIDICIENIGVAIELKTVNTNYRDGIAENKTRPITKNIQDVLDDVAKHARNQFPDKFIIFVVFPISKVHDNWKKHLALVEEHLGEACWEPRNFSFESGVGGSIYYGRVRNSSDEIRAIRLRKLREDINLGMADLEAGRVLDGEQAMAGISEKLLELRGPSA